MTITITPVENRSTCTAISKIIVDGGDLNQLKGMIATIMLGKPDNPNDGLQEIVQGMTAQAQGQPAMPVQTVAVRMWLDLNPQLYDQLAPYHLQAKVSDCRLGTDNDICKMVTDLGSPASPDLYANLVKLMEKLNGNAASLTYYIFDQARPHCAFFGVHHGVVTLALETSCK